MKKVIQSEAILVGIPSKTQGAAYAADAKKSEATAESAAEAAVAAAERAEDAVGNVSEASTTKKGIVLLAEELGDLNSNKVVTEGLATKSLQDTLSLTRTDVQTISGEVVLALPVTQASPDASLITKEYADRSVIEDKVMTIPVITDHPNPDDGYTYDPATTKVSIDAKKFLNRFRVNDISQDIRVLLFTIDNAVEGDDIQMYIRKPYGVSIQYFIGEDSTPINIIPAESINLEMKYLFTFTCVNGQVLPISLFCVK